jgi:hypothetical protein
VKRALAASMMLLTVLLLTPSASAEDPGAGKRCRLCGGTEAVGGDGVIAVESTQGRSEQVPGRGDVGQGYAPGRATWAVVDEEMAPTCPGNTRTAGGGVCGAAVNTCPGGLVRFWIWHQTTQFTRSPDGTTSSQVIVPWHQEPGAFCLGADDPGVPTIARVIDQVQRDFKNLPLRRETVQSDPGPTTLINFDTAFSAGTTQLQSFDPVLLGTGVHITATPRRWHWTWGDGTTAVTDTPGVPKQPVVTHRYTQPGDVQVSVVVEWTGTFTVGNDPTQYQITGPASVPAAPTTVRVRTARSELVAG